MLAVGDLSVLSGEIQPSGREIVGYGPVHYPFAVIPLHGKRMPSCGGAPVGPFAVAMRSLLWRGQIEEGRSPPDSGSL